ncbi:MAG: penicillin acylase family protein [Sandaracinus sp.]|nr:penicillin acylase family protein [Sandaracinus sp.]MCB9625234.1 penicillin acylase family protein [Sandaracinus sp.]
MAARCEQDGSRSAGTNEATLRYVLVLGVLACFACGDDDVSPADAGSGDATSDALLDAGDPVPTPPVVGEVPETARLSLPGLSGPAHVVFTESHVPHVYAATEEDAARVLGYVVARDRWFEMDMARRLSAGRISELLGEPGLATDLESRGTGMTVVLERTLARFTESQRARFTAFAEGATTYADDVRARRAPAPQELELAALLLGVRNPGELMAPMTLRDIAALSATITYQLGFETTDVGRQRGLERLDDPTRYDGVVGATLREAGMRDAFFRVTNSRGYASAGGWGLVPRGGRLPQATWSPSRRFGATLDATWQVFERLQRRLGRSHDEGFGSNAWAVGASRSAEGVALLAGDGHLPGSVPTLFYRAGVDTRLLSGDDAGLRQIGLFFPGVPVMAVGTNGEVAWSQTQAFGDITDWYGDELVLDAAGKPRATRFGAEERALVVIADVFEVADVPALESVGRTETVERFETFDGRLITSIEGRVVNDPSEAGDGETAVRVLGRWVVPSDTDADGIVTATSFDYTGLDGPNFALALDAWGRASTVEEMRANAGALVAYSQNVIAADATGSVLYLPYQAVPCRAQLRGGDGRWAEGAHPGFVIDGTRYAGFEIPLRADGTVDESLPTTDARCVVPADAYPAAIDPSSAVVVSANNDPGPMAADDDLQNDPHYIGGPWHEDFRAARIDAMLTDSDTHDEDSMARAQADVRSPLGELMTPLLLEALDEAKRLDETDGPLTEREGRVVAGYAARRAAFDEVRMRLGAWQAGGYLAQSGVVTSYHPSVTPEERANAVATSIFNAWLGPFDARVLGDERFPESTFTPTGSGGRMRTMTRLIEGRGAANPLSLASFDVSEGESIFFDVLGTPEKENAIETALLALADALDFLASPRDGERGGFGTASMDEWLWGLRHTTRFDALVADFLEGDDSLSFLADTFSITTEQIPLADDLAETDPRFGLTGFPRPGDNFVVDAANSGFSGTRFSFGSIPVFRMVIALRGDATTGRNVLPGGQSGRPASPYYADQARLWLANETTPMRFSPTDVVEGATEREVFVP